MSQLPKISPQDAAKKIETGEAVLIDIREPDEHAREQIVGAKSLPLSSLPTQKISIGENSEAIFHCKSGMRTDANCMKLAEAFNGTAYILEGGIDAWRSDGLETLKNKKAPLELNRQVQITAGMLILAGFLLGRFVHPEWHLLSGFVGAGLTFAGISGWCGMAHLLAVMPWNKSASTK
ncbi:rhodanese family protein [Hirschia maritima]|uniref:rhodanese family protein n=1 Tax=Hirschia maritima TaxID=1121961 RepID=UPI0003761DE5|nr:rhodanese family protein [Hirschia maritima]